MSGQQYLMVSFTSRPGQQWALKSALLELVQASRTEPDCIKYDLAQSNGNPELFFLVECWASAKGLTEHQQTTHFIEGIKKIEALTIQSDVQFVHWVEPGEHS